MRVWKHGAVAWLAAALAALSAAAQAQFTQPRQDDPRALSEPGGAQGAPFQAAQPLPYPAVVPPTITNDKRQPQRPQGAPSAQDARRPPADAQGGERDEPGPGRGVEPRAREPQPREAQQAAPERNEFQDFILSSTGQRLPLFGHNLFEAPSTFAPVDNVPVTPDYVVGPGDELVIRAWGQIDIDYRALVDRSGMISIPRVGAVPVAGVRYAELAGHIRSAVARNFRNFDLVVSMGQLRSVQVFVVGYARRPGRYTVSSLSTLVNAVFAAGGPSLRGSMRAIQLKRGSRLVTELDLYDLLLAGDKSKDAALLPGDVIYVPPVGPLAAVIGSVNNPAVFELRGGTTLGQLMQYAGGLATTAQARQVTLERIEDRKARRVQQLTFDQGAEALPVRDGDVVSVLSILPRFEETVTLRGNVATPLRHPYRPGMRVRDLIPEKEALLTAEYYRRQNFAVRAEPLTQGQLSENVRKLSDEINWDYAVIERLNPADLTTSLIPFNLGKAVLENDPAHNLHLQAGDVVTVFSKGDVAAPAGRRPVIVSLEGEFNFAGVYQTLPGETLRELVVRVGGVTPQAYIFGAELMRESTRRNQEERLKQALLQFEQDLQRATLQRARNVTSPEEAAALNTEAQAQQATLARLRMLRPSGRIVMELPLDATVADLPAITLEDGDRVVLPQRPGMVSVFGTVFNESSFLYRADKTVADYLAQAGGPRPEADRRSIYLLRADGSVVSRRGAGLLVGSLDGVQPMPGDAIVVPEDFSRTSLTKDLKDWTQIFYQFGLGAAALQIIKDR